MQDSEKLPRGKSGSGEIRTHEQVPPSPVFKTGAFNRSATLPRVTHYTEITCAMGMTFVNPAMRRCNRPAFSTNRICDMVRLTTI